MKLTRGNSVELGLRPTIERMPRVDLHRHLEGSLRVETLAELVKTEGLDLPPGPEALRAFVQVGSLDPKDPYGFLEIFRLLRQVYRSPEIIRRVTREAIADAAADNVRYLELRFTPAALAEARQFPLAEVVGWVLEAAEQEAEARGIRVGMVMGINRREPISLAEQVAELAIQRRGRVVGLDLAGNEIEFPADPFSAIFAAARQAGLGITVHAGEWTGAESVRRAIEVMGAERIGHGVHVLEDPAVAALARERRTVFEVCLSSNLHTGVVARLEDHPLPRMLDAGLQVTLNTDDPGISNIRLSGEHLLAVEGLGCSLETLKGLTLAAVQAAFLPRKDKARLEAQLQAELF
ncbi:MAG: adenosine deaminase [Chloroflexota bacterium]